MKNLMIIMIAMLMSIGTSAFAGTTTAQAHTTSNESFNIPTNLTIKQTVTFGDGNTVVVYYMKQGNTCSLYSPADITKYSKADLNRIKASNFEITDHVEGKCYLTRKTSDIIAFAKRALRRL